jgi:hypothetical protein
MHLAAEAEAAIVETPKVIAAEVVAARAMMQLHQHLVQAQQVRATMAAEVVPIQVRIQAVVAEAPEALAQMELVLLQAMVVQEYRILFPEH